MKQATARMAAAAALATLAGCGTSDTTGVAAAPSGDAVAAMSAPCIAQAARLTGIPESSISVTGSLQTGGGPLLTLAADGTPYSCRQEADGSVTVFSEYAN